MKTSPITAIVLAKKSALATEDPAERCSIVTDLLLSLDYMAYWDGNRSPSALNEAVIDFAEGCSRPEHFRLRYGIYEAKKFVNLLSRYFPFLQNELPEEPYAPAGPYGSDLLF